MTKPKRRGHGEGSIFQRKDGKWEASMTLANGKRKCFYGKTRTEVRDKLARALHEQKQGTLITGPQQTVASFLTEWLVAKHEELADSTYEYYRNYVERYFIPHLGRIKLNRLTREDIQRMYPQLRKHGKPTTPLHPNTIRHIHKVLVVALNDAKKQGKIADNPATFVVKPKYVEPKYVWLDLSQAQQLLETLRTNQDTKHEALIALSLASTMRLGELIALCWSDVELDKGVVHVTKAYSYRNPTGQGYQHVIKEPKTSSSKRTITLPDFAIDILRRHRARQAEQRLALGAAWVNLNLVFPNNQGSYLNRDTVLSATHRLLAQAGLPMMRFHDLRHSAATIMLAMGVNPKVVQERLGHASIVTTMNIYGHVSEGMQAEVARQLERVFRKEEEG